LNLEESNIAQTIWIHRLSDARRAEADEMDYIRQHFQALTQTGSLTKAKGWNPVEDGERACTGFSDRGAS